MDSRKLNTNLQLFIDFLDDLKKEFDTQEDYYKALREIQEIIKERLPKKNIFKFLFTVKK